jgi:SpoVK/Ycf46/Vps4 family AAA+-type ATPase
VQTLAYDDLFGHLADELMRVDCLIRLCRLGQERRQSNDPLAPFAGLVLSDEEILGLLNDSGASFFVDSPTPAQQAACNELRAIDERIAQRRAASADAGIYLPLARLAQLFGLSAFEEQCLLICLAPEVDRKYEKLYAYLQDDVTRKKPCVALLLDLLCRTTAEKLAARASFDPQSPLLKFKLLLITDSSADGPAPLTQRFLKLDDRIVNFLLDSSQTDARLNGVARLHRPALAALAASAGLPAIVPKDLLGRVLRCVRSHPDSTASRAPESDAMQQDSSIQVGAGQVGAGPIFYFCGPYGVGKLALAEAVCGELGLPLLVCDVERLVNSPLPFEEAAWLLVREAALQGSALCLETFDCLTADEEKNQTQIKTLLQAAQIFSSLTFILGAQRWMPRHAVSEQAFVELAMPVPDEQVRRAYWMQEQMNFGQFADEIDWDALAGKFRFTPGQIRDALATARDLAAWREGDGRITADDLHAACRAHSNQRLTALAQKIQPKYVWRDIVLPADRLQQLREICNYVRYRTLVYQEWGFDGKLSLGKGLNALFAGPSGTGKTMSAEIMAGELGLDLYKIDLSTVVSKFIGETEKNLSRIFAEAETSNSILFFDEADALFGRRSEVRDSHDRYANIEIGYLLQKMEEYQGVVILATNFRKNMDDAFVRRMHFTIEFPFPDEKDRRRIWEQIWPERIPISPDLNLTFMARKFEITGGAIRNIALAAAFLAAADGRVVTMSHLIRATRREYQKMGKVISGGEFGEYAGLVEPASTMPEPF